MKRQVTALVAALSALALSACGGGATTGGQATMPAAQTFRPMVSSVVVTATKGGKPLAHLEISITRNSWPGGKLITKGATGPKGKVKLSGDWTAQQLICAGGTYYTRDGYVRRSQCVQPFPTALTLRF